MKGPAVSLLLGVCVLLLSGPTGSEVSLDVRPNLQQFFSGERVSLSCGDGQQTVKRTRGQTGGLRLNRTRGGQVEQQCGGPGGFGVFNGSSCSIPSLSQSDSGVYWCETSSGERSLQVNITVSLKDGPLILEIPALPVATGSDITLRCRSRGGGARAAYFLRNGVHAGNRTAVPELSIRRVQLSDEGFYSCSTDVFGPSAQSRLRVTDPPPPPAPPAPPLPLSLPRLSCLLLVACLYCVCTVVMVTLCRRRRRRRRRGRRPTAVVVSMETAQSDHEYDDLTADVTTEL